MAETKEHILTVMNGKIADVEATNKTYMDRFETEKKYLEDKLAETA